MPMPQAGDGLLYAMYVQATRFNPNNARTLRRQWVVLPPLPTALAVKHGIDSNKESFLTFSREQTSLENRVKWRHAWDSDGNLSEVLSERISVMLKQNIVIADPAERWTISPVITAQLTPRELSALQAKPETPYALLRRFAKVASKVHGLSI